jgi:hypothetical protein
MAQILIEVPDEYIPGIEAARHISNASGSYFLSNEEFSSHVAVEAAKSWCQQYKVGSYWEQPQPQFNIDGTPYGIAIEEPVDTDSSSDV